MNSKTVQIYLPNGELNGVKIVSIITDKVEIIQIPRSILSENNNLLNFNGFYILIDSIESQKPEIYIGKGNVKDRVYSHNIKKDFWNMIFAVNLKDEIGFSETHTSYLEYYFINKARSIKQLIVNENKQIPNCPKLSLWMKSELEYYIGIIEMLFYILGFKFFQENKNFNIKKFKKIICDSNNIYQQTKNDNNYKTNSQQIRNYDNKVDDLLFCKDNKGNYGTGRYIGKNSFILYKGAICNLTVQKGSEPYSFKERNEMIKNGLLIKEQNHYILQTNKEFKAPTAPIRIIFGRNSNGYFDWKNDNGETLDSLLKK